MIRTLDKVQASLEEIMKKVVIIDDRTYSCLGNKKKVRRMNKKLWKNKLYEFDNIPDTLPEQNHIYYTVITGDTLYKIA